MKQLNNLTESEELQKSIMQNKEFVQWFSGSKATDKNGNPMVMFHGTQSDEHFTVFSVDGVPYIGDDDSEEEAVRDPGSGADPNSFMGAHFAEEPEVASKFAIADVDWLKNRSMGRDGSGRVYPVFLKVTNPKIFKSEDELNDFIYSQDVDSDYVENAMMDLQEEEGIDYDELVEEYESSAEKRIEINMYAMSLANNMEDPTGETNNAVEYAKDLGYETRESLINAGYDGVKYKNDIEGGISWIIFKPNQVKSIFAASYTDDEDIMKETTKPKAPNKKAPFTFKKFMTEECQLDEVFEPKIPSDLHIVKKDKKTGFPNLIVFRTDLGNMVTVELGGSPRVMSVAFKVNGSFADMGRERDADIISGVLGVVQKVVEEKGVNIVVFIGHDDDQDAKYMKGADTPNYNRREAVYIRLIKRFFEKDWDIDATEGHIKLTRKEPIDHDIEDPENVDPRSGKNR